MKYLLAMIFLALAMSGAGCGSKEEEARAKQAALVTPAVRALFTERCAVCHGESGKGDGPASATLQPKPRDYSDSSWQASVKDEDIRKTILYGGAAVGKSPAMPSQTDLDGKPELDGLIALVRSFNKN